MHITGVGIDFLRSMRMSSAVSNSTEHPRDWAQRRFVARNGLNAFVVGLDPDRWNAKGPVFPTAPQFMVPLRAQELVTCLQLGQAKR
jgi:hypothetical protein